MRKSITDTYSDSDIHCIAYTYYNCYTYHDDNTSTYRNTDANSNDNGNSHAKFDSQTYAYPAGYTNTETGSDSGASSYRQAKPMADTLK